MRKHLTYANVMATIAVFLVLAGGGAYAAKKLKKNSVTTKSIKNKAVTEAKLGDKAVTNAKIGDKQVKQGKIGIGAIINDRLADGAVSTGKTNFAFTSGRVALNPSAGTTATQTLLTASGVSLTAKCTENGANHSAQVEVTGPSGSNFAGVQGGTTSPPISLGNTGLPGNVLIVNLTSGVALQYAGFDVITPTNTLSGQATVTVNSGLQSGECVFSASATAG